MPATRCNHDEMVRRCAGSLAVSRLRPFRCYRHRRTAWLAFHQVPRSPFSRRVERVRWTPFYEVRVGTISRYNYPDGTSRLPGGDRLRRPGFAGPDRDER